VDIKSVSIDLQNISILGFTLIRNALKKGDTDLLTYPPGNSRFLGISTFPLDMWVSAKPFLKNNPFKLLAENLKNL